MSWTDWNFGNTTQWNFGKTDGGVDYNLMSYGT